VIGTDADLTADSDSVGCLCVVASFSNAAQTVEAVTAEAAKRVLMSPMLSDFIEFDFAYLGPHPGQDGDYVPGVQAIANALLGPRALAGRNYFAIVMVDRSAIVAAHVLSQCAADPFVAPLRPGLSGISNTDDRPLPARSAAPRIETSPTGLWTSKDDMVAALYRLADGLQRSIAASRETGLAARDLADLKTRYGQQPLPAVPPAPAVPPVVPAAVPPAAPAADATATLAGGPATPAYPAPEVPAAPAYPAAGQPAEPPLDEPDEPGPAGRARRRWLPELRRPRGERPEADGAEPARGPGIERLVYLLIVGDESSREEAALNRNRAALLEVDKRLAELSGFSFRVRMLHGDEDSLRGDTRDAGQLGRRDVKKIVGGNDFAAVLEHIRASLKRDPARKAAEGAPAVLLFTPEPPIADTAAAALFRELAMEAKVIWALPRSAKSLLSEVFTDAPGVRVIADDDGVADEVAVLLGDAPATPDPGTAVTR
jgi:hypothetical protein